MHIDIENVDDQEQIPHRILLISGRIRNYFDMGEGDSKNPFLVYLTHCSSPKISGGGIKTYKVPMVQFRFKVLLELTEDENVLTFEYKGVFKTITLHFKRNLDVKKTVKIVYVVSRDADGTFQTPEDEDNGLESALKKITLAVGLIQCFIADGLQSHGLGRKTFTTFDSCQVFTSSLTMEESHSLNESQLWEYHAKELLSRRVADDDTKVLAVLSATRYVNTLGRPPKDHAEMMSLTKSHGALGGGGLALFGSGCLYTWPSGMENVQDAFLNPKVIDSLNYMDDSGYRHTYGACFSTTLGAILHELGHTFDLGHTEDGIMARGFDDLHRYFTIHDEYGGEEDASKGDEYDDDVLLSPTTVHRFTSFKKEGASYLQHYQQKKELRRMLADQGKAFWSRSCALILSSHKWFNPIPKNTVEADIFPSLSLMGGILSVDGKGCGRVILLECRKNDKVIGFMEVPSPSANETYQEFSLEKLIDKFAETNEIVVVTSKGFIWRCQYPIL